MEDFNNLVAAIDEQQSKKIWVIGCRDFLANLGYSGTPARKITEGRRAVANAEEKVGHRLAVKVPLKTIIGRNIYK